jgi:hypothetical protein
MARVLGASQGIGAGIARALAAEGCNINAVFPLIPRTIEFSYSDFQLSSLFLMMSLYKIAGNNFQNQNHYPSLREETSCAY